MTTLTDPHNGGAGVGQTSQTGSSAARLPVEVSRSHYRMRIASQSSEIRAAQVLRFVVFNLELREGLEQSYSTCLDADAYDAVCDHLIVEDVRTNEIIGTYRMQTGRKAAEALGYYSAQEFDFKPFESIRHELVEVGRACVHSEHRNLVVLSLLWKGVANYVVNHGCRYMIGCSSLTSQNPAEGWAAYQKLQSHLPREEFRTIPLPEFACPEITGEVPSVKIPKLLSAYMLLGAKICGPPALDRQFKTIDFLTFLDFYSMTPKTIARYLG